MRSIFVFFSLLILSSTSFAQMDVSLEAPHELQPGETCYKGALVYVDVDPSPYSKPKDVLNLAKGAVQFTISLRKIFDNWDIGKVYVRVYNRENGKLVQTLLNQPILEQAQRYHISAPMAKLGISSQQTESILTVFILDENDCTLDSTIVYARSPSQY